jgi:lysophospholipase L1-like esterase
MSKEKLEWTHYESWEAEKKVLFIGDSIIWGARSYIENILPDEVGSTVLATAHGVNEIQYSKSISMLATLNDPFYEVVYFNNGLHPRGQTVQEYAENYERVVVELMKTIPAKKWILGLSTPISNMQTDAWDNTAPITEKEKISLKERNDLVLAYNEKVKEIARKLEIPYYNAYGLLEGHDDLKTDPYHYNQEGKKLIAGGICECILKETAE